MSMMVFSTATLGIWRLAVQQRRLTILQIQLDQCTGKQAYELRHLIQSLAQSNQNLKKQRAAIKLLLLEPSSTLLQAALLTLKSTVIYQEKKRLSWKTSQLRWTANLGCTTSPLERSLAIWFPKKRMALPLPPLPLYRPPPDSLGPQPLEWLGAPTYPLTIQLIHSPRGSQAQVFQRAGLSPFDQGWDNPLNWTADWTALKVP